MINLLEKFLEKNLRKKSSLLLAFSGGGDSTALLHLLLELKKSYSFTFDVAHVDHGWREDSQNEQVTLENKVKNLGLTFHKTRIEEKVTNNLEDHGRKCRLKFFEDLNKTHGYQAILFAHHKDDLVETVLKRVLEGANLFNLYGMKPISKQGRLTIWRPLLQVTKNELEDYLHENKIEYIHDPTNLDTRFLRGRMRKTILPFLNENFGKEFSNNLALLASRSYDLKESLEVRTSELLNKLVKGPLGSYFDLNLLDLLTINEQKFFFYSLFKQENISISRINLQEIFTWSLNKDSYKQIQFKDVTVIIDRQKIFFLKQSPLSLPTSMPLSMGVLTKGNWKITLEKCDDSSKWKESSWQDLWHGNMDICIPKGTKLLNPSQLKELKSLTKWQSSKKVPVFLRKLVPVIAKGDEVVADLLSGFKSIKDLKTENSLKMKIEIK